MREKPEEFPVAVIGAGPVGLAAAARLVERGIRPVIFERGPSVGQSLLAWGHVRVFSPWVYNIDAAAAALLEKTGWSRPDDTVLPTGAEIVREYLQPLAGVPEIAAGLRLSSTITAIARDGLDKVSDRGREASPFVLRWMDSQGVEFRTKARAVVDASGNWTQPNPMGTDGLAVPGERALSDRIAYGIPDVGGSERELYAGKRVLVVGGGHSAINIALDLLRLRQQQPATEVFWALRRDRIDRLLGGGLNDQLPERGALGMAAREAMKGGMLTMLAPFCVTAVRKDGDLVAVDAVLDGKPFALHVDRIIVATGFRPDLSFLRELRVSLDPAVEAPPALAPLIDPNLHSCGPVPPHGVRELSHPEPDFYIVGSKSYGRAPTFLMATGYEQVRSVVAEIAGDHAAARDIRLVLPETGVCNADPTHLSLSDIASDGCCGGAAPVGSGACCVDDEAAGTSGCGCSADDLPVAPLQGGCCRGAA